MHMSDMSQAGGLQTEFSQTKAAGERLFARVRQHVPLKHPFMSEDFGAAQTRVYRFFLYLNSIFL